MNKVEIICQNCKQDTLLKRESCYDGFNKIGTKFVCASCGFIFKNEESISFKISKNIKSIFNDKDCLKQKKYFLKMKIINYADIALFILLIYLRNTVLFTRKK